MKTAVVLIFIVLAILIPVYVILTVSSLILKYRKKGERRERGKKLALISGIIALPIIVCLLYLLHFFTVNV